MSDVNQKMTGSNTGKKFLVVMALLVLSAAQTAWSNSGDNYSMNIDISGTVVANGSCTFNQGGELKVDFKDVKLKAISATTVQLEGDYTKPLASDFLCTGDSAGLLQMQLNSSTGSYETYNGIKVLGADKGIVGVQLLLNGAPQNMGEWFTVDQNSMPALKAQLVQVSTANTNNVVSGDIFHASATLILAFN